MQRLRLASLVRRWALFAGLALCCVETGCSGGQTGGESPIPAAGGGCDAVYEEFAIDALTPLGATAESVLAPVLGINTAPLLWSSNTGSLTIGPEQGLSQVELIASYAGGRIAWAHYVQPSPATGALPSTLSCAVDRLEVELEIELRTAGGALDERFVAKLGAVAVDIAQLTATLPVNELRGSFFVMTPANVSAPALQVNALWDVFGFRGSLMGGVEMLYLGPNAGSSTDGVVGFGFVPYAEWPPPTGNGRP
jgi:hypothetical protein